jgi:hypothetical protein
MSYTPNEEKTETTLKVLSFEVHVFNPFAAGHVVTELEARALNRAFAEGVRNNCVKKIKELKEDGELSPPEKVTLVQELITAYANTYTFDKHTAKAKTPVDLVAIEALQIATEKVKIALKDGGYVLKDVGPAKIKEFALALLEKYPEIMKHAADVLKTKAELELNDIDLTI